MASGEREEILKLMDEKDALEREINELNQILAKNGVDMNSPLVDNEGFPLASVDIYQVRHARHLLKYKQNDHKSLMLRIEAGLAAYYSSTSPPPPNLVNELKVEEILEPFAKIHVVHPGSPADIAGIQDGDLLLAFGSVNGKNFANLGNIGDVVKHSEGHKIDVRIKRNGKVCKIMLTPKQWNGNGLLGCNVLPV